MTPESRVTETALPIPSAEPGPPAKVEARFAIRHDLVLSLGIEQIAQAVAGADFNLKSAIGQSVARAYLASGLRRRSGHLWQWAVTQFNLSVRGSAGSIFIQATWNEEGAAAKYWKAQLWGVWREYSAKRPNMYLKARKFVIIDNRCKAKLTMLVNRAIAQMITRIAKGEKAGPQAKPAAVAVPKFTRRPTPFKLRKFTRSPIPKGLGFSEAEARRAVASAIASGKRLSPETVIQAMHFMTQGWRQADFAKLIAAAESMMKQAPV